MASSAAPGDRREPRPPTLGRLTAEVPQSGESFDDLAVLGGARVEHIVSSATPDPALQVQDWDEWVLVIQGGAVIELSGSWTNLVPGDWMLLPAGTPHRVLETRAGTHWIAVHGPRQPTDDAAPPAH